MDFTFKAKLWEWQGKGAWCFVTVPTDYYETIKMISSTPKHGFGSVRVEVTVGKSIWKTSIFPDSKTKSYLLPIKKAVRSTQGIAVGDDMNIHLRLTEV